MSRAAHKRKGDELAAAAAAAIVGDKENRKANKRSKPTPAAVSRSSSSSVRPQASARPQAKRTVQQHPAAAASSSSSSAAAAKPSSAAAARQLAPAAAASSSSSSAAAASSSSSAAVSSAGSVAASSAHPPSVGDVLCFGCKQPFECTDGAARLPRTLPCGHPMCTACCKQSLALTPGSVLCPHAHGPQQIFRSEGVAAVAMSAVDWVRLLPLADELIAAIRNLQQLKEQNQQLKAQLAQLTPRCSRPGCMAVVMWRSLQRT